MVYYCRRPHATRHVQQSKSHDQQVCSWCNNSRSDLKESLWKQRDWERILLFYPYHPFCSTWLMQLTPPVQLALIFRWKSVVPSISLTSMAPLPTRLLGLTLASTCFSLGLQFSAILKSWWALATSKQERGTLPTFYCLISPWQMFWLGCSFYRHVWFC